MSQATPAITHVLSPEWLRQRAEMVERRKFPVYCGRTELLIIADAIELADDDARCLVESECRQSHILGVRWWDSALVDPERLAQAIRYLEARGLIERHPDSANLVRFLEISE